MRARDVVGRKIVKVNQTLWKEANVGPRWVIESMVLDDGTILTFGTLEGESDYGTEVDVIKPERKAR